METRISLEYIVENLDYTEKLASALDTTNYTVKKQVFELLSALCLYSLEGHDRALEALDKYKENKNERYRLKLAVEELRNAPTTEYKQTLLAFINCVIDRCSLKDRIRMRNELMGLRLLEILHRLKKEESDETIMVQIGNFEDRKYSDEEQIPASNEVDLNSHMDVFYAILKLVVDTPQEIPFLSILQHLLRIDPKEPISDIMWDTAETLVHRATLIESKEDSSKLLRTPSHHHSLNKIKLVDRSCMCSCHKGDESGRKRSVQLLLQDIGSGMKTPGILSPSSNGTSPFPAGSPVPISPPPPPCLPGRPPPPPPPPPPGGAPERNPAPPPPPPFFGSSAPPPPPPMSNLMNSSPSATRVPTPPQNETDHIRLPQQETPKPKSKMRSLNWNKIPVQKVLKSHNNIWSLVARQHNGQANHTNIDFEEMEYLFCQPVGTQGSPKLGRDTADGKFGTTNEAERKKKEPTEITLLDAKRSLNINIFLKQFRSSNDEIIELMKQGANEDIGAEKLRGLLKILPQSDETEMLKSFNGDRKRLGNAEKFLLQLLDVSRYKLRIEGMLLKEEFTANLNYLEPSINAMIQAANDLKTNKALQEVLFMVLVAGNFINAGGYAGDAAGFRMTSLQKLTDIRANKPGMNLIHYVAQQAEKMDAELLNFPEELIKYLEDAAKVSIEQLKGDIMAMDQRITQLSSQVEHAEPDIQEQMTQFLEYASNECKELQTFLELLERVRIELGEFFCEDVQTFKLEECYRIFFNFCAKFKAAVEENKKRRTLEEKAEARRRQREDQLAKKRYGIYGGDQLQTPASGSESETGFVDPHLWSPGFAPRRFNEGSFNVRKVKKTNLDPLNGSLTSEDEPSITSSPQIRRKFSTGNNGGGDGSQESPDVTPTGTMRSRRRSRLPSDDAEENLMDFLRHSSLENEARERRSWGSLDGYGSLDRSFGRRSRRKRPDLLNAEFMERERPASPGPLTLPSPTCDPPSTSESESKSKQLKQKIEAWLDSETQEKKLLDQEKKRKAQQQQQHYSWAEDAEVGNRNSLHTVHEDKPDQDLTKYHPVYADRWKTPIVHTNIEKALELVENAQVKDKSAWRKSTLNVPNTTEPVEEDARQRARRARSQSNIESSQVSSAMQAAKQQGDTLKLYFRSPSQDVLVSKPIDAFVPSIATQRRNSEPMAKDNAAEVQLLGLKKEESSSIDGLHPIFENDNERQLERHGRIHETNQKPPPLDKSLPQALEHDLARDTIHEAHNDLYCHNEAINNIYSRTPSGATVIRVESGQASSKAATESPKESRRYSRTTSSEHDADSENIETPPTPRRVRRQPSMQGEDSRKSESEFVRRGQKTRDHGLHRDTPRSVSLNANRSSENLHDVGGKPPQGVKSSRSKSGDKDEDLGDGQFDRFASIRRSRRIRKTPDHGESIKESSDTFMVNTSSDVTSSGSSPKVGQRPKLQRWEEKLQELKSSKEKLNAKKQELTCLESEKKDIDDAVRDIQKTGSELKEEMERSSSRSNVRSPVFGGPESRINEKSEEEKVTGDYEKVTSRGSSRGMPSTLLSRSKSRPTSLPLQRQGTMDVEGGSTRTFTSTYAYTPTSSPERELEKSPSPPMTDNEDKKLEPSVKLGQGTSTVTDSKTSRREVLGGTRSSRSFREPTSASFRNSTSTPSRVNILDSGSKLSHADRLGGSLRGPRTSAYTEAEPDEGFEESQSLTGEFTSQGSNSFTGNTNTSESPCIPEERTNVVTPEPEINRSNIQAYMRPLEHGNTTTKPDSKTIDEVPRRRSSGSGRQLTRKSPFNSRSSLISSKGTICSGSKSSLRSSRSSLSSAPTVAPARGRPSPPIMKSSNGSIAGKLLGLKDVSSKPQQTLQSERNGSLRGSKPIQNGYMSTISTTPPTRIPRKTSMQPQRRLSLPRHASSPTRVTVSSEKQPLAMLQQGTNPQSLGLRRSESLHIRNSRPQQPVSQLIASSMTSKKPQVNRTPSSASSSSSSAQKENSLKRGNLSRSPPSSSPLINVGRTAPKTAGKTAGFGFMRATTASQAKKMAGDSASTMGSRTKLSLIGKTGRVSP